MNKDDNNVENWINKEVNMLVLKFCDFCWVKEVNSGDWIEYDVSLVGVIDR